MDHWMFNCHNRKKAEFLWNSKKYVNYATPLDPFELKLNKSYKGCISQHCRNVEMNVNKHLGCFLLTEKFLQKYNKFSKDIKPPTN